MKSNTSNSNIITFPVDRIIRNDDKHVSVSMKAMRKRATHNQAEMIMSEISESLYYELVGYGLDVESEYFNQYFSFILENIRALVYKEMKLKHHLQSFVEKSIELKTTVDFENENKDMFKKHFKK